MAQKESTNNITVNGLLVDHDIAVKNLTIKGEQKNVLTGKATIRVADGSEVEVSYFVNPTKKDGTANKNFTDLQTTLTNAKTVKNFGEQADYVKIGGGSIGIQDYPSKDRTEMKSYNDEKASFLNVLTEKEKEQLPMEAKFEVEGIIHKVSPELVKEQPTGNYKIILHVLGYQGTIVPVTLTVMQDLVQGFMTAGYVEGMFATFFGKIVNTSEETTETIQVAFGEPQVRTYTTTTRRLQITGGKSPKNPMEEGVDFNEYKQALGKREAMLTQKLEEAKKNQTASQNGFPTGGTATPNANGTAAPNPFANGAAGGFNPFQPQ